MVLQHDLAVTPAAWMLNAHQGEPSAPGPGKILLVADPIYESDDPRLAISRRSPVAPARPSELTARSQAYPSFQRIRFTGEEAAGIAAQFPPADVDKLVGIDATRERLLALDWSHYRFIHIATHGIVDAQVPELSALILGSYGSGGVVQDPQVRLADLSLETVNAEVAVLSACETALGSEARSEGLAGLSSVMLARGARAVVASLWPVPDEVSARLMTDFYRHMLTDSMGAAQALGAAMRTTALRGRSADPALWAAFQLSVTDVRPTQQVVTGQP